MLDINNEELMQMIAEEFPNEDWEALPDIGSIPDIYKVRGKMMELFGMVGKQKWREVHFEVQTEFATREEAEKQVQHCYEWEDTVPNSIEIVALKPSEALWKDIYKDWRKDILSGNKVLPIACI